MREGVEGFLGGLAGREVRVFPQLRLELRDRVAVADPRQGVGRGGANVRRGVLEGGDERRGRVARADLSQRVGGDAAHAAARVGEGARERRHRPPVHEPAERVGRVEAHLLALVAEQFDQRFDRRRVGDLDQRRGGVFPRVPGALDGLQQGRHRPPVLDFPHDPRDAFADRRVRPLELLFEFREDVPVESGQGLLGVPARALVLERGDQAVDVAAADLVENAHGQPPGLRVVERCEEQPDRDPAADAHEADRGVGAQRRVLVPQQGHEILLRARVADLGQRDRRETPHRRVRVVQTLDDGVDGAGRLEFAEQVDGAGERFAAGGLEHPRQADHGRVAHVQKGHAQGVLQILAGQGEQPPRQRAGGDGLDVAERGDGALDDLAVRVVDQRGDGRGERRVAQPPEHVERPPAHARLGASQQLGDGGDHRALADGDQRFGGGVHHQRVRVLEQPQHPAGGLGVAYLAERVRGVEPHGAVVGEERFEQRLQRRLPDVDEHVRREPADLLAAEHVDERVHHLRVGDLAERVDGVEAVVRVRVAQFPDEDLDDLRAAEVVERGRHVDDGGVLGAQRGEKRFLGALVADLAERRRGVPADDRVGVLEGADERVGGRLVADHAERVGHVLPDFGVRAGEQRDERRDGLGRADLPEGVGGEAHRVGVGRAQGLEQGGDRGILELGDLAHRHPAQFLVGEEGDQGADGFLRPEIADEFDDLVAPERALARQPLQQRVEVFLGAGRGRGKQRAAQRGRQDGKRAAPGRAPVAGFSCGGAWRVLS